MMGNWPPADAPTIQINDAVVTEGHTGTRTATFVVNLSSAFSEPVTVDYVTDDGTAGGGDYQAASGTLTFAPGETEKTITIKVKGDRVGESNESYFVNPRARDQRVHSRQPGRRHHSRRRAARQYQQREHEGRRR